MGSENRITIIGIDCATQQNKQGLAVSIYQDHRITLQSVYPSSPLELIFKEIDKVSKDESLLFAFDAPLGWPVSLGNNLIKHSASLRIRSYLPDQKHLQSLLKDGLVVIVGMLCQEV